MWAGSADRGPGAIWLGLLFAETVAVVALALLGASRGGHARAQRLEQRGLVRELTLTDLALWSEAGYCRHPSLADRFSPWATHPSAIEHFPAGSFVPPPAGDWR